MSRREDRFSEATRHRSRFDREPRPKRSRRDGKVETERLPKEPELKKDRLDRVHRNSYRLRDPLPLEAPLHHDSKVEFVSRSTESEKVDGHQGGTKHSSDPTRLRQSRSHFQHGERGNIGKDRRSFDLKADRERGWWGDLKEAIYKTEPIDTHQKNEQVKDRREGDRLWQHDGYFDMEANPNPLVSRRPSFREQKIPAEPDEVIRPDKDMEMPNSQKRSVESGKRDKIGYLPRRSDKIARPFATERNFNKAQAWRGNVPSRERFNSRNRYGGRERFTTGQGNRQNVEKWKHDLYDEANKSPPPKNEEDNISKIEALLAS